MSGSGTGSEASGLSNTTQDLVTKAYQTVGIVAEGATPTSAQLTSGALLFNTMIRSWSSFGIDTWARANGTITCTSGDATYTIGPSGTVVLARPIRIMGAYREDSSGQSVVLTEISKQEYYSLPDKDMAGVPTQFYFDQESPSGNFYIWPVPGTNDLALTITFDARIPIAESVLASVPNLPDYWQEPIIYNLGVRLGIRSGRAIRPELQKLADETLKLAKDTEYDEADVYLQPDIRYVN